MWRATCYNTVTIHSVSFAQTLKTTERSTNANSMLCVCFNVFFLFILLVCLFFVLEIQLFSTFWLSICFLLLRVLFSMYICACFYSVRFILQLWCMHFWMNRKKSNKRVSKSWDALVLVLRCMQATEKRSRMILKHTTSQTKLHGSEYIERRWTKKTKQSSTHTTTKMTVLWYKITHPGYLVCELSKCREYVYKSVFFIFMLHAIGFDAAEHCYLQTLIHFHEYLYRMYFFVKEASIFVNLASRRTKCHLLLFCAIHGGNCLFVHCTFLWANGWDSPKKDNKCDDTKVTKYKMETLD